MNRNGVSGERVYGQQIKIPRWFAFEREAGVSQSHGSLSGAFPQIIKLGLSYLDHCRIDLVEPVRIAWPRVHGQRASPQPDYPDTPRVFRQRAESGGDARFAPIVGEGNAPILRREELGSVMSRAVAEDPHSALVAHTQHAVEIAELYPAVA